MKLRWNWGMGMAAVYSVFALGTSGMVALSIHEPVNLVTPDYYEQAVGLDDRRGAQARAAALGSAFAIAPDEANDRVEITWPRGVPIESGTVTLYRPSDSTQDRVDAIRPDERGRQIVTLAGLSPGRWALHIEWRAGGAPYYAEREIVVGATHSGGK